MKVIIVGGGIGGLTLASALQRRGIASDIVEIKKDWTVYGVGITAPVLNLTPNTLGFGTRTIGTTTVLTTTISNPTASGLEDASSSVCGARNSQLDTRSSLISLKR